MCMCVCGGGGGGGGTTRYNMVFNTYHVLFVLPIVRECAVTTILTATTHKVPVKQIEADGQ